jgi:hypothetical protein
VSHAHPPAAEAGDAEQFRAHAKAVLADVARKVGWRTQAAASTETTTIASDAANSTGFWRRRNGPGLPSPRNSAARDAAWPS